jgi:HK97 family phage prohead protease
MMTERDIETRSLTLAPELRSSGNTIGGYASPFDVRSQPLPSPSGGLFVEVVSTRAWNKAQGDNWSGVESFWEHKRDNPEYMLGTTKTGSLRCGVDNLGLWYEVDLLPARYDLRDLVARGDVGGSSVTMIVMDDQWAVSEGGFPVRTLNSCKLIELGPTANPAYLNSSVSLRSLARFCDAPLSDVEERAAAGDLRGLLTITSGPPKPTASYKGRIDEMRKRLAQERYVPAEETEPAEAPEPAPEPVAAKTIQGRSALIKTLEMAPVDPRVRLAETMAARSVPGSERLAETERMGTVSGQIEVLLAELASTRADIARLSDPNRIELEDARAEVDRADQRARDELDRTNGTLSGAAALRLMGAERRADADDFAREDEVGGDYADPGYQADKQPRYPLDTAERITLAWGYIHNEHDQSFYSPQQLAAIKDRIQAAAKAHRIDLDDLDTRSYERWVPRPTLTGAEALRRTMALALPEPVRNAGRACDQYGAEQGGRF